MTVDVNTFRWLEGDPPALRYVRRVKGEADSGRQVHLVIHGEQQCALKTHRLRAWSHRWRARARRSHLACEYAMLRRAEDAGLPVPQPLAYGQRCAWRLPAAEALLVQWLPGRTSLRWRVAAAFEQNQPQVLDEAISAAVALLAKIRSAGFADPDFTLHHVLTPEQGAADDVAWIDLETARPAAADELLGTAQTVGRMLGNIFVATGGSDATVRQAMGLIVEQAPEPRGGWAEAVNAINPVLANSVRRARARGRIDRPASQLAWPVLPASAGECKMLP